MAKRESFANATNANAILLAPKSIVAVEKRPSRSAAVCALFTGGMAPPFDVGIALGRS
jgi:hypothetical protein